MRDNLSVSSLTDSHATAPGRTAFSSRPWVPPVVCVLVIAVAVSVRLVAFPHRMLPVGFGVPLVLFAFLRSRFWLWVTVVAFAAITIVKFFFVLPDAPLGEMRHGLGERGFDAALVLVDVVVIGGLVDFWVKARFRLESHNEELAASNRELAAREEEIARQNEEMQSQAEELERQAEELRIVNEDLGVRGRTLESLLALSRALATSVSRDQTFERICATMGQLSDSAVTATAILELDGPHLSVRCHHGFDGGVRESRIVTERSFASLILSRDKTGYIENLRLRPDLDIPQPLSGPPFVAVLSSPLRVEGKPVGSLEIYRSEPGAWSDEQVGLLESLAAQASVSLEAAHLFESVQEERSRLEAVLRAVPVGIIVSNGAASLMRVNPAGAAVFNVPTDSNIADRAVTAGWQIRVDNQLLPENEYPVTRAVREGQEMHGQEVDLTFPDGRQVILLANTAPIRDSRGDIAGGVAAFVNITPQKELQRELDLRRRDAEEASVRKTRFLAALSHDIRTPANAISLLAELIRRSAANPALAGDVPNLAQELHSSAVSLVNLLSDVLDLARFDSGRIDLQETEFNLGTLLEEENRQMLPLAREKGLELIYVAPSAPLHVRADRIKLSRILGNLVGNAIKFTERGEVRVDAARTNDGGIALRVSDTGIGIAEKHLRHIFDEFFQLRNPERDRTKGTGLGLTICRRLVDAMGGRLDVESIAAQGSAFTVELPASCVVRA